jgi:predicted PurR-regulated permease PerM
MSNLVRPPTVERFRRWGIIAWSVIGLLVLATAALFLLLRVNAIFPPLVVALVTIYLLNPLVTRFERLGIRRLYGSCLSYVIALVVIAAVVAALAPSFISQSRDFARDFPQTVERIGDLSSGVSRELDERFGVDFNLTEWIGERSDLLEGALTTLGGVLRGVGEALALIIIGLVLGLYLLIDLPRIRRGSLALVPPDRREEIRELGAEVSRAVRGYFRGSLLVAVIVGIMSAIALRILGLPYWAPAGMIAGFFNLIPLLGPFIGAVPAILIAGASRPPITMLWVAIALTIVQQIVNYFIAPNVMRWTVRVHPVTIMLSLAAGGILAGFFGLLMAVPVVASAKAIAGHFWRTRVPWGADLFEAEVEPPEWDAAHSEPLFPATDENPAVPNEPPPTPDSPPEQA